MVKIYHNPRCRKSREALQLIEEKGVELQIIEYLKTPPSKDELRDMIKKLGIRPIELIRRGEEEFKSNFKGKEMTDEEWISAMIEFPKLMERPIVINGQKAAVGRPPENVLNII